MCMNAAGQNYDAKKNHLSSVLGSSTANDFFLSLIEAGRFLYFKLSSFIKYYNNYSLGGQCCPISKSKDIRLNLGRRTTYFAADHDF
jgi:hypothetical protein